MDDIFSEGGTQDVRATRRMFLYAARLAQSVVVAIEEGWMARRIEG